MQMHVVSAVSKWILSIISKNHQTLKCQKITKKTKIPIKPKKLPKYYLNLKNDINTP